MVNSRAKGSAGEREICKLFRDWWGGDWERRSLGIPGCDLIAPKDFPWAVEVKNWAIVEGSHFFHPTLLVIRLWKQTKEQAVKINKKPLLVLKAGRKWFVVMLPEEGYKHPKVCLLTRFGSDQVWVTPVLEFFVAMETLKCQTTTLAT